MESLKRQDEQRMRLWAQLKTMEPTPEEVARLVIHLRWLRLAPEARLRTEYLPGMGRRRSDPP